ncbi:MAG: D-alanyl-D-alanine carboxypeptidase [Oscillospiraceae bacterium]|nr:D-alanyl-D-alanine carboxypeptidase [Oscillospiraceae bacterium]
MKKRRFFLFILTLCILFGLGAPAALALEVPQLNGQAAVLVDLDAGRVLYGYNMDAERAPASLTKVMTVLLALEAVDSGRVSLDEMIVAQDDCLEGLEDDSSTSGIAPGVVISMKDLLYCALLQSANEACNIIGRFIGGSISGFVDQMNRKAEQLGCQHTHFVNTNGLPAENHYSSAYDQYLIFAEAMKHPLFMEISNTASYSADCTAVNNGEPIGNSNALINITSIYSNGGRYLYEGASGGKTGYTRAAGYCLISTAQRNGVRLLAVAMGCDGQLNAQVDDYYNFVDSRTLYDWGFNNFSYRTLLSANEVVERQEVELAEGDAMAMLRPQEELRALMPNEATEDDIRREIILYNDTLRAPIGAGTVLGEVRIYVGSSLYGTSRLVNSSAIELSRNAYLARRVGEILSKGWVIALISVLLFFTVIYLILITRYRRLRKKHLRERRRAEKRRREEELQKRRQGVSFGTADPVDRFDFSADMSEFFDDEKK